MTAMAPYLGGSEFTWMAVQDLSVAPIAAIAFRNMDDQVGGIFV
jgi:hypothetical protein